MALSVSSVIVFSNPIHTVQCEISEVKLVAINFFFEILFCCLLFVNVMILLLIIDLTAFKFTYTL